MTNKRTRLRTLTITICLALLTLASTFLFPYGFSAIHEDWAASFWLFISHTGGTLGVPFITLIFCFIISFQFKGWQKKVLVISLSLFAFSFILGGFARINEYFIKEELKVERPNMLYLKDHYGFNTQQFYGYNDKTERKRYLRWFLQQQNTKPVQINNKSLHPKILEHWIDETGYSFPSGHSVNAFLMSTLIGYILLFIYSDFRRKTLFLLPFLWATLVALSRVILGVHSPTDITLGAFMGCAVGILIISTGFIDKYLKQKKS